MLEHVSSSLERRGDTASARSLGVIRDLAAAASIDRGESSALQSHIATAEPITEPPKHDDAVDANTRRYDDSTMDEEATTGASARGYYRLLYKEVRAGRNHGDEVDGDVATGRAMDRVLGMRRSEEGHWAAVASRLDFVYLCCSQASPQLLSMLEHSYQRTMRARRVADADGISSLIAAVRATLAGVKAENPANHVLPLQSLHSSPVRQPVVDLGSPTSELESALKTVSNMVSQLSGLTSSPFGTPSSTEFGPSADTASLVELSAPGAKAGLDLDALVSEALQTWGGGTDVADDEDIDGRQSLQPESGIRPAARPGILHRSAAPVRLGAEGSTSSSHADRQAKEHAGVSRRSPPRRKERRAGAQPKTISASAGLRAPSAGQVQSQSQMSSPQKTRMQRAEAQPSAQTSMDPPQTRTQRTEACLSTTSRSSVQSQRAAQPEIRRARRTLSDRRQTDGARTVEQTAQLESSAQVEKDTVPHVEMEPQKLPEPDAEQEQERRSEPQMSESRASVALALAASSKPASTSTSGTLVQRAERLRAERAQKASEAPALMALQDAAALSRATALKANPTETARAKPDGSEHRVNQALAAAMMMHGPAPTDNLAETRAAATAAFEFQSIAADGNGRSEEDEIHDDDLHAAIMALA